MAGGLERVYGTEEDKVYIYILIGQLFLLHKDWCMSL